MQIQFRRPKFSAEGPARVPQSRWWLLAAGGVLLLLLILRPRRAGETATGADSANSMLESRRVVAPLTRSQAVRISPSAPREVSASPEEVVQAKVKEFGRHRRELVRKIARRSGEEVPRAVEEFFDAIESGDWDEIKSRWDAMAKRSGQYDASVSTEHEPKLDPYWSAVLDAYGVAEQAHEWPAQQLLDYGTAILDSLRPGMVYVGGTDNGRWIPTLLNETSDGERHVVLTQNALADMRYLEFVNELYGDQFKALNSGDSQKAFADYVADAQRRLEHDQQFPNEPKQIRFGEDVQIVDGRVQVSGQVAVMSINEKLLSQLREKNPDRSFALQESIPFEGTYADALPLGPLMELGARSQENTFTPERAAEYLEHWQNAADQILSDSDSADSTAALKSYSHDTAAAANLLAAHNFVAEAEQAYRLGMQLWPENPQSVGGLADLLVRSGRETDAQQILRQFAEEHPDQLKDLDRISAAWRLIGPKVPGRP